MDDFHRQLIIEVRKTRIDKTFDYKTFIVKCFVDTTSGSRYLNKEDEIKRYLTN